MTMYYVLGLLGGVLAYPTLEEAYGPLEAVMTMSPPWKASNGRPARSESFHNHRSVELCDFPIDVLLLQDATASFDDNFDAMVNTQLPTMVEVLGRAHPGSRYAAASFRDKPLAPFGTPATDYCVDFAFDFTSNVTVLTDYYAKLTRVGGGDPPENQFGALLAAGQTFELTWASNADSAKLIVLVTDAPPHFEGDGNDKQGMATNDGHWADDMADSQCLHQYYPSPDQVLRSLQAVEGYTASIVYDPEYMGGLSGSAWQWFNRFAGQPDTFVNIGAKDNSDFWAKLSAIISQIEQVECGSTPTASPTTPSATATPVGSVVEVPTSTSYSDLAPPPPSPPASVECAVDRFCEDGVQLKFVRRPANLTVIIDGVKRDI